MSPPTGILSLNGYDDPESRRACSPGVPLAQLLYVSQGEIGKSSAVVTVDRGSGMVSAPVTIPAVAAAPALFTLNTQGTGMAAAVNQDGTVNGLSNPAAKAFLGVMSR